MTNSDILKEKMVKALEKSMGIVTDACKAVGIARQTHYRWTKEDKDYNDNVESISGIAIDFAETQLYKQIENGVPASTIFYLKTKGKSRGYVEKQEMDFNVQGIREISILPASADTDKDK